MPDTPTFPLLPADRRFVEKLDRYREYVPRPAESYPYEPTYRTTAAGAGTRLRKYVRAINPYPSRRAAMSRRPQLPSLLTRLPPAAVPPLSTGVAASLIAFELTYLLTCRPDLNGRPTRRVMLTPLDVRRALAVTRSGGETLRGLARVFARRTGWDGGWFT